MDPLPSIQFSSLFLDEVIWASFLKHALNKYRKVTTAHYRKHNSLSFGSFFIRLRLSGGKGIIRMCMVFSTGTNSLGSNNAIKLVEEKCMTSLQSAKRLNSPYSDENSKLLHDNGEMKNDRYISNLSETHTQIRRQKKTERKNAAANQRSHRIFPLRQ